jgi:iron(III) transport system substrate-binding protein
MQAWAAAVCFNVAEAEKLRLPKPTSWNHLLDERYRGRITMPDPSSSGTGYFHVSAWIQLFGDEQAWRFMDGLHANIAAYEHSGTKPCRNAASGEFPVGISYELAGVQATTRCTRRGPSHERGWRLGHGFCRHPEGHPEA